MPSRSFPRRIVMHVFLRSASILLAASVFLNAACSDDDNDNGTGVSGFAVSPLLSDQTGVAPNTDPNLVNAWGLAMRLAVVLDREQRDRHHLGRRGRRHAIEVPHRRRVPSTSGRASPASSRTRRTRSRLVRRTTPHPRGCSSAARRARSSRSTRPSRRHRRSSSTGRGRRLVQGPDDLHDVVRRDPARRG